VAAGADSFYAGIFPSERIGELPMIINRRNHPENNFRSVAEFRAALAISHRLKRDLFVAFNEHFYPPEALSLILELLEELLGEPGLTGVIVTDIGLLIELGRRYPQLVLVASTGCVIQNSGAASLFTELGVKRAVLPRSMTLNEIHLLVQARPDMSFECFVLNDRCPNVDGLCHFVHADFTERRFPTQCRFVRLANTHSLGPDSPRHSPRRASPLSDGDFSRFFGSEPHACGACYLPILIRAGVGNMKIVGRDRSLDEKERAVRFLAEARTFLMDCLAPHGDAGSEQVARSRLDSLDFRAFQKRVKALRRSLYAGACSPDLCYYPEPPWPPSRRASHVSSRSRTK
jgi:putative protease